MFVGGQAPTLAEVEQSIIAAGATRGWNMLAVAPGRISGILDVRNKHHVEIRIDYDINSYSITYLNSRGLMAENGMIHRNYNRWITNLESAIRSEQIRMARTSKR